ncbi:MAG: hypothetical protein ACOH2H_09975 [Cypionkella sp.]
MVAVVEVVSDKESEPKRLLINAATSDCADIPTPVDVAVVADMEVLEDIEAEPPSDDGGGGLDDLVSLVVVFVT